MELPVTTHLKEVKLYQHLKQILYLTWVKVPKATVKPPWVTTYNVLFVQWIYMCIIMTQESEVDLELRETCSSSLSE